MVEETGLTHQEDVSKAAHVLVKLGDLTVDGIRVAGKDQPVLHKALQLRVLEHLKHARGRSFHRAGHRLWRMIAGRAGELERHLIGLHIPHQLARSGIAFLIRLARVHQGGIGKTIQAGRGKAEFGPARPISIKHLFRPVEAGQKTGHNSAALPDRLGRARTEGRDPDGRVRLLIRPGPDIDLTMVKVFALPVERPVVTRPGFENQIIRFPKALHHARGPMVAGRHLIWHATHKADLQASAGVDIDHGHLLCHPHRLAPVGNRVAENQQAGGFGFTGEDTHDDRAGRVEIGRGLMVLVDHDVEPQLLGNQPFVDKPVIQVGSDFRIVVAVGEGDADRVVLFRIGQQMIGVFAEMPGTHEHGSFLC